MRPEHVHELGVAHRRRAGQVHRAGDVVLDEEPDRGDLVGERDPRPVLPPAAELAGRAEQRDRLEPLEHRRRRRRGRGRCAGGRRARPPRAPGRPRPPTAGTRRTGTSRRTGGPRARPRRRCRRSSRPRTRTTNVRGPPYSARLRASVPTLSTRELHDLLLVRVGPAMVADPDAGQAHDGVRAGEEVRIDAGPSPDPSCRCPARTSGAGRGRRPGDRAARSSALSASPISPDAPARTTRTTSSGRAPARTRRLPAAP